MPPTDSTPPGPVRVPAAGGNPAPCLPTGGLSEHLWTKYAVDGCESESCVGTPAKGHWSGNQIGLCSCHSPSLLLLRRQRGAWGTAGALSRLCQHCHSETGHAGPSGVMPPGPADQTPVLEEVTSTDQVTRGRSCSSVEDPWGPTCQRRSRGIAQVLRRG